MSGPVRGGDPWLTASFTTSRCASSSRRTRTRRSRSTCNTFDPDADDDGRAQDYGVSVIEAAPIVGDGSRDGYNVKKLLHLASLLEHAPDLLTIAEWLLEGKLIEATRKARTVVGEIEGRELKYPPEVKL